MITISIFGLDQYTVGHYSKEHTQNLASIFEVNANDILFCAPDNYVFHEGIEQTSWNAIIKVDAPDKFEPLEAKAAKYLLETLKEFSIHLTLEFHYFHLHHQYERINKEYPRYITEDNMVDVDENDSDAEELYEGNVFAGMEEKLEEAYRGQEDHCHRGCGDDHCDCDDDCDCEDGECHCGHKH